MLQVLPPELLLHTLGYLGPDFFRQDIRRLTISRFWYQAAFPIFAQHLDLTASSLVRFANDEAALIRAQPFVTTIILFFDGLPRLPHREKGLGHNHYRQIPQRIAQIDSSLATVAALLPQCSLLRNLKLTARPARSRALQSAYLSTKLLADLLSVPFLTSLEFDTAGSFPDTRPGDTEMHLCGSINALLPSLRRLRCRMDNVCEALLELPADTSSLRIEEVIINLSISGLSETITAFRRASRCSSTISEGYLGLQEAIEAQAVELSRVANARTIRILSHRLPSIDIFAFDAILGRRFKLDLGAPWDSEGSVVDDIDPEDETDLFNDDDDGSDTSDTFA